ncbi:hypothetical protein BGZ63DRAFT_379969, partial [Mariannaea sp. PMI_226]
MCPVILVCILSYRAHYGNGGPGPHCDVVDDGGYIERINEHLFAIGIEYIPETYAPLACASTDLVDAPIFRNGSTWGGIPQIPPPWSWPPGPLGASSLWSIPQAECDPGESRHYSVSTVELNF